MMDVACKRCEYHSRIFRAGDIDVTMYCHYDKKSFVPVKMLKVCPWRVSFHATD